MLVIWHLLSGNVLDLDPQLNHCRDSTVVTSVKYFTLLAQFDGLPVGPAVS